MNELSPFLVTLLKLVLVVLVFAVLYYILTIVIPLDRTLVNLILAIVVVMLFIYLLKGVLP